MASRLFARGADIRIGLKAEGPASGTPEIRKARNREGVDRLRGQRPPVSNRIRPVGFNTREGVAPAIEFDFDQ